MDELESLKSYLNNVELQLYEANEHVSELLEKVSSSFLISFFRFVLKMLFFRVKRWKSKTWT